jgi:hypothetical protein
LLFSEQLLLFSEQLFVISEQPLLPISEQLLLLLPALVLKKADECTMPGARNITGSYKSWKNGQKDKRRGELFFTMQLSNDYIFDQAIR